MPTYSERLEAKPQHPVRDVDLVAQVASLSVFACSGEPIPIDKARAEEWQVLDTCVPFHDLLFELAIRNDGESVG